MNGKQKRIQVIREAMLKVARIMAGRGIKITQAGTGAFVRYNSHTGCIERINIPMIPDDASEDLIHATHGFLDHEIGHVLFTEYECFAKANRAKCGVLFNIAEDTYVERMMQSEFTGSISNLGKSCQIMTERYIEPKLRELLAHTVPTEKDWWGLLCATSIRAIAGQEHFIDYMNQDDKWDLIPNFGKVLRKHEAEIKAISSSQDSYEVALKIKQDMLAAEPEEQDSEPDQSGGDDQQSGGEGKAEKPQGDSEGETDDGTRADDTFSKGEGESSGEEEKDDSSSSSSNTQHNKDSEDDDQSDESDADSDDSKGESGSAGSDSAEEGDGESDEGPGAGDSSGDGSDDDEDSESEGRSGGAGSSAGGDDAGEGGDSEIDADDVINDPMAPLLTESEVESMGEDFDDAMTKVIGEMSADALRGSEEYVPFTRDWDVIEPLKLSRNYDPNLADKVADTVNYMVGTMAKSLERAFRAANRSRWEGGKKSGRINSAALSRLLANDPRVMRTRQEMKTRDVAVSLLVDCSGSMSGKKMEVACQTAWALGEVLSKLNLPCEILGFTTCRIKNQFDHLEKELADVFRDGTGQQFSRFEPIYIPIFKSFDERFGTAAKARLADAAYEGMRRKMNCNIDGESLLYAAERLRKRPEPGKVMIVLSDGAPAGVGKQLEAHLKKVVKDLNTEGINTVGIGIMSQAVRSYYPRHVILNKVEDLPKAVVGELREAILAKD